MEHRSSRTRRVNESGATAVEVAMLWGDRVISVKQWQPPCELWLGDVPAGDPPCDFPLSREMLGTQRAPLLVAKTTDEIFLVVGPGAAGSIELSTGQALTLDHAGHAYCGEHADVFIAIGETPIGEAELSILLIHRPHVTAVG